MKITIESGFLPTPLISCEPLGRKQQSLIHILVWIDTRSILFSDLSE